MEDMEFLKAMLAEMNANMKSNQEMMKSIQDLLAMLEARIETNRETDWEERKAERMADQDDLKRMMEEINAKMDGNQAEMRSTSCLMRFELKETIQHGMKVVLQPIQLELNETTACNEATD
jgi:hypothetical protein